MYEAKEKIQELAMPQWNNDKMEKDSSQKKLKTFAIKSSLYFGSYHISTFIFSKKKGGIFPLRLWTKT